MTFWKHFVFETPTPSFSTIIFSRSQKSMLLVTSDFLKEQVISDQPLDVYNVAERLYACCIIWIKSDKRGAVYEIPEIALEAPKYPNVDWLSESLHLLELEDSILFSPPELHGDWNAPRAWVIPCVCEYFCINVLDESRRRKSQNNSTSHFSGCEKFVP